MTNTYVKHGTERGYRAENARGSVCERCRAAHRVYGRQFSKSAKAKGIKYETTQVIDQYDTGDNRHRAVPPRTSPVTPVLELAGSHAATESSAPSLGDRIGGLLAGIVSSAPNPDSDARQNEFIPEESGHEYISEIDPDPDPQFNVKDDDWEEEVIINEAGMKKIQENLGFYVVTVGMTFEMIDPYCGRILAEHADDMIQNWSKVIAHYPGIAKYFLSQKGGIVFAWINALQSTWPFLKAIYDHHLGHNIKIEDGVVYRYAKGAKVRPIPDPTMPPGPDTYNYSVG